MTPVICLDPGHGGKDPGARCGGLVEADLTLAIASAARTILAPKYQVILTRTTDLYVPLSQRVAVAEDGNADLFVSIHVNSAEGSLPSGYEAFVRPDATAESLALASSILVQFSKRWPDRKNRGLKSANFVVVRQSRPACLMECFFVSSPIDRKLLADSKECAKMAEAIAWGCDNFASTVLAPTGT